MRRINITEADVAAVATEIAKFAPDLPNPEDLVNPVLLLFGSLIVFFHSTEDTIRSWCPGWKLL